MKDVSPGSPGTAQRRSPLTNGCEQRSRSLAQFDKLPDSAHVRLPVVVALFDVSVPTVWRWTRKGVLPTPLRLGRSTMWPVGELRKVIAAR